jgi:hypothetical protein
VDANVNICKNHTERQMEILISNSYLITNMSILANERVLILIRGVFCLDEIYIVPGFFVVYGRRVFFDVTNAKLKIQAVGA